MDFLPMLIGTSTVFIVCVILFALATKAENSDDQKPGS